MKALTSLKNQHGASIGSVIFKLGILIVIGFMAARVGAFYIDDRVLANTLKDLNDIPQITNKSKNNVMELLKVRLRTNDLKFSDEEIIIDKSADKLTIDINYERSTPLLGNMSIVMFFENHFEVVRN